MFATNCVPPKGVFRALQRLTLEELETIAIKQSRYTHRFSLKRLTSRRHHVSRGAKDDTSVTAMAYDSASGTTNDTHLRTEKPKLTASECLVTQDEAEHGRCDSALRTEAERGSNSMPVESMSAAMPHLLQQKLPPYDSAMLDSLSAAADDLAKLSGLQRSIARDILDAALEGGSIHEQQFYDLGAEGALEFLLRRQPGDTNELISKSNLKKAASIYLTKFYNDSHHMSRRMLSIGDRLCRESYMAGLYSISCEVFHRRNACRGEHRMQGAGQLLLAMHAMKDHEGIFRAFRDYYVIAKPDQLQHWKVLAAVIDSVLQSGEPQNAETVLVIGTNMAKALDITTSTTAFLKVLGEDWRRFKDIDRTKRLFDRLQPLCSTTNHPSACYGAIIQCCVIANDENAAKCYYAKLRDSHQQEPGDVVLYSHFARAKAMRQDWVGVQKDFQMMARLNRSAVRDRSAAFIPIMKIFAETHAVQETLAFIGTSIHQFDLRLHRGKIRSILKTIYGSDKAMDLLDSLPWKRLNEKTYMPNHG